jgi:serine/threonine protein kinase
VFKYSLSLLLAMPYDEHSQRDDFQFLSKLGSGSFGTVYKVKLRSQTQHMQRSVLAVHIDLCANTIAPLCTCGFVQVLRKEDQSHYVIKTIRIGELTYKEQVIVQALICCIILRDCTTSNICPFR